MNHFPYGIFAYYIPQNSNYWPATQPYHSATNNPYTENPGLNPQNQQVVPFTSVPATQTYLPNPQQNNNFVSQAAVDLMRDNRSLWEEHVAWTRMAIISLIFKLPDIDFVLARLLKNATDMGEEIRPLYGDAAADRYATLIKDHLLLAADLVKAAIAGDDQAAKIAEQKWYQNADEIAAFLNSINQFLPEEEVRAMFYKHLDLTKQEALTMLAHDFQKDIEIYDEIEKQAREMADMISDAMIKLYPNIFRV